ncbi:MAG: hypothetical protein FJZ86_02630 [Chloroflexi bacterium]|nr:hypothetical protein [Chloroflexota bacterium]
MAMAVAKPSFEDFIRTCMPLLRIPELEQLMRERVSGIVSELLHFESSADPAQNLKQFLQKDENFLGVLLALTNLSQEKFLRIITAQRFAAQDFGPEWSAPRIYEKIKKDDAFAEQIARLFLEGRDSRLLTEQVADFYLDQLSLPANWSEIIRDQNVIGNIVRKKLAGEYTDQKGAFVERQVSGILDKVQKKFGVTHAHGQVKLVGKEIDHAIPSLEEPYVMVMVSYMETTSSNQTTRANEQQAMYQKIVGENVRYPNNQRVFVNVVDGAGWLARRSDLRKIHEGCHYCLNMQTLDQLEPIVLNHIPKKFFKK